MKMNNKVRMVFPLSINPEILTKDNFIYSIEAYNSVLKQLSEGIFIYDQKSSQIVGKSVGVEGNQVSVELHDKDFAEKLAMHGENYFCIGTGIDADVDVREDGVKVVTHATVEVLTIIPKMGVSSVYEKYKETNDEVVLAKEPTLSLGGDIDDK